MSERSESNRPCRPPGLGFVWTVSKCFQMSYRKLAEESAFEKANMQDGCLHKVVWPFKAVHYGMTPGNWQQYVLKSTDDLNSKAAIFIFKPQWTRCWMCCALLDGLIIVVVMGVAYMSWRKDSGTKLTSSRWNWEDYTDPGRFTFSRPQAFFTKCLF